ncbi:MAG: glycosyltransferase, partial [Ruminiclostridium sp.]|nr:glycosyltransferase [Ruminiclostridium sp.]
MPEKKRLSLCMVVKNDEKYLSGCLQDLKEVADEIVIADIGSADQTVKIAEQAGARVYRLEWKDNYSEAKNLCMEHAEGKWVLFLRANETISGEQLKELVSLLDNPNTEGYLLYKDNRPEDYGVNSPV